MFDYLGTMDGPHFLGVFLFWFFLIWISLLLLRRKGFDTPLTTVGCLFIFEGLGVARILIGSAEDLHEWGFLIVMMIVGALFFVIRVEHIRDAIDSSKRNSCSGTGGCGGTGGTGDGGGGGGCGGGGCGGCGG